MNEPSLLIMKSFIRYMYKQNEAKDNDNGDEHIPQDNDSGK